MLRRTLILTAAASMVGAATAAQAQSSAYYTVDPYDVSPPVGATPTYSVPTMVQMNPFAVGYNLLSGYRPIYSGARQPVGHELIGTHDNGVGYNGYVYRPVYGPSPGYRYSVGGALVVEFPNVRYPAPAYLPPDVPQVVPTTFELPVPQKTVAPGRTPQKQRGPREF